VDNGLLLVVGFCAGGDGSTRGLENQGRNITKDEADGVCEWFEARWTFAEDKDDACEAEVDGRSEEGWASCESDEVPKRLRFVLRGLSGI